MPITRKRIYLAFPRPMDATPRARHCRETDATRERIARPLYAIPRKLADWR